MGLKIKNSKNIVTDGLILHLDASDKLSYSGSGTTWKDRSSNGYDGTLVNGASFDSSNGGNIKFDGIDDRVNIGGSSPLLSSHVNNETSVFAWVYLDSFAGTPYVYLRIALGGDRERIRLGIVSDGRIQVALTLFRDPFTQTQPSISTNSLRLGLWQFIGFTYDASDLKMYKNGSLFYEEPFSGSLVDSSSGSSSVLGVDQDAYGYNQFLDGRISELYCYDRALTASEIAQTYNATKGRFQSNSDNVITDGLILNLDASDSISTSEALKWLDKSGNGDHAIFANANVRNFSNDAGGSFDNPKLSFSDAAPFGINDTNDFSFEAWIKVDSITSSEEPIMGRGNTHFRLFITNGQISFKADDDQMTVAGGTLQADVWTHVAATYHSDSSSASIYKDGVFINSDSFPAAFGGGQTIPFQIGANDANAEEFFGSMAEVRVYDRDLTASEVLSNYNATKERF